MDVGVPYNSGPMNVTGGTAPYTYSILGTLPGGLTLNTTTGAITGTATDQRQLLGRGDRRDWQQGHRLFDHG